MNEKIQIKYDFPRTRENLSQLLNELSDEALKYVCRPIWYAYLWTDEHDMDVLTDEDIDRFSLIGAAVNDTSETVAKLRDYKIYLLHQELRRAQS